MNSNQLALGAAVVALAAGAAGGYVFARKQLERKYEQLAQQEIAEAKEFYARLYKKEGFETPEKALETLGVNETEHNPRLAKAADAMRGYQGGLDSEGRLKPPVPVGKASVSDGPEGLVVNVFQRAQDDDDDIVEPQGEQDVPFIIKQATFMQDDQNYTQATVTWYAQDGVLADDRDEPIDDVDMCVGLNNLDRFGQSSGQPNVVYVRNDVLGIDYEILRSDGSFAKEVLGIGT